MEVCRVREAWLHPLHVEVAAAHAAAHTAAVAAGAWDEACVYAWGSHPGGFAYNRHRFGPDRS